MFNLASKYNFVFSDCQANLLLMLIEEYVNGAELQISRIEKTRKLVRKTLHSIRSVQHIDMKTYRTHHLKIFCDAHFYFICVGQVNKCLKRLCGKLGNKNLNKVYSKFQTTFKQEIRNDLEHIDGRVVGRKKKGGRERSIGSVRDFKNLSNDNLTFNDKEYPVNKESLDQLKRIYEQIITVIHEEYAVNDASFVNNITRDKRLQTITRIAQREYQKFLHSKRI
jgi:hypothetical protein